MIPPVVYRCPDCGHVGWSRRFAVVSEDGPGAPATDDSQRTVECPACGFRFEPVDAPWLK